jgi:Secretion system C-terminal sorting domain
MHKKITHLFIALLCAFSFNLSAQTEYTGSNFQNYLYKTTGIDSIITEEYDTLTKKLLPSDLDKFTYNAQCKITKSGAKSWNRVQKKWIDYEQTLFNYDAQARLTSYQLQVLRGTVWADSLRVLYAYTGAATQEISQTTQLLVGTVWTNDELKEYTYTAAKKAATETEKGWDGSTWLNNNRSTSSYDAQNRITTLVKEDWNATKWVNLSRETYTFNAQNKLQNVKNEDWNKTTNAWEASDLFTFVLAPNGRKVSLGINFFGIPLNVDYLGSATGYLDSVNIYLATTLFSRIRFVYNPACQTTATNDVVFLENAVNISPNPTADNLTIRINDVEGDAFSATIFNASGIAVDALKWNGKLDQQRDISRLPNGLYFLSVKGEKWQAVQKFMVQH